MSSKQFNPFLWILIILFVIGMLLASNYSSSKRELASISIEKKEAEAKKITKILTEIDGVKTVFLDQTSTLVTFRYNSNQLKFADIKDSFRKHGIEINKIHSIDPLDKNNERNKTIKSKENLFDIEISSSY